uniref:Uncharacterized protein n=1 Tax=Rhizophora mucronata TaxID=61149 RepID=A0A2P2QBW1_RHIMU
MSITPTRCKLNDKARSFIKASQERTITYCRRIGI